MGEKEKMDLEREILRILEKLDRIDTALRGNGTPGVMVRLDRIERCAARDARILWAVISVAAATVADAIIGRFV